MEDQALASVVRRRESRLDDKAVSKVVQQLQPSNATVPTDSESAKFVTQFFGLAALANMAILFSGPGMLYYLLYMIFAIMGTFLR